MGGILGAVLAAEQPDRVITLTTMSEPDRVDVATTRDRTLGYESWEQAVAILGTREWWIRSREKGGSLTGSPEIDEFYADVVGQVQPHVAVALARWATTWVFSEILQRVRQPTLLIWPGDGGVTGPADRDRITASAPAGEQLVFPGVRTMLYPYMYADLVAPIVARFITRATPPLS